MRTLMEDKTVQPARLHLQSANCRQTAGKLQAKLDCNGDHTQTTFSKFPKMWKNEREI